MQDASKLIGWTALFLKDNFIIIDRIDEVTDAL